MRGRKPRPVTIADSDLPILQAIAHHRRLAWFQVQHARIVLAVAAGEPIQVVASQTECDRATVWRVCRRYEQGGLKQLLLDDSRLGRPQEISPPATSPDRRTGLSGTDCRGAAYHALDQRGLGSPGCRRRYCGRHQPPYDPTHPARRGLATASHALLANCSARRSVQGAGRESALVLRECGKAGSPGHLDRSGR